MNFYCLLLALLYNIHILIIEIIWKEIHMAKETLKAKIERLERENLDLRSKNNDLHNKLASNLHDLDEQFKASPLYKQLIEENEVLAGSVKRYK